MSTMKVILKQDVSNFGEEGDIKFVKRGFARNYLFPKELVVDYSKENIKILESKKEYFKRKRLAKIENVEKLKEDLEKQEISIAILAGDKGRLYGTVTTSNIAEELNKLNFTIEKKQIDLKEHIKFSGTYKYRIHLYHDIYANMELNVIAKNEKPKAANKKYTNRSKYKPDTQKEDKPIEKVKEKENENVDKSNE